MDKTEGSIISEYGNGTREDFLFTYSESEKQKNEINKNNAGLLYEADFYPLYTDFLKLDINTVELVIISYLYYWTKKGKWIYTNNESLATLTKTSTATITRTLKNLVDKGYISINSKKMMTGTDRKMQVTQPLIKMMSATNQNDESYNNNKKNNINTITKNQSNSLNSLTQRLGKHWSDGLTFSENVMEWLIEYNNIRKKKLEKLTDKGVQLVINKLQTLGHGTDEGMIAVLKQSIENGWEGLFEVKGFKPTVNYDTDLGAFYNEMKKDYEGLKNRLGVEKFMELKPKALRYAVENKLL